MSDFKKTDVFVTVTCIASFFEYKRGSPSFFRFAFDEVEANQFDVSKSEPSKKSRAIISGASLLAFSCLSIALHHMHEMNVLSLIHVYLMFLVNCAKVEKAMTCVASKVPWSELCSYLNVLIEPKFWTFRIPEKSFPIHNIDRPLPKDFIIRGQIYSQSFFPDDWFKDAWDNDEELMLESSMVTKLDIENRGLLWS